MKLSQFGRFILAAVSLTAMSLSITACAKGHTVAFLYVASTKVSPGNIYAYKIDGASGALTTIPDSPFQSGGRNPVALTTTPNGLFLYVANHDDSSIVENAIGVDGKIYPQCTYNIPGGTSFPTYMATDPAGKFLLVAFTYQPGFTNSVPGNGGIVLFPIQPITATANASAFCTTSAGTLGTPVTNTNTGLQYFPVGGTTGLNPVALTVTANNAVFITTSGKSILQPGLTQIVQPTSVYGFNLNTTTGQLTATNSYTSSTISTATAATCGSVVINQNSIAEYSALTSDTSGKYLYVTDIANNTVTLFTINSGVLTFTANYTTGTGPSSITFNTKTTPNYLYVSNCIDNTVSTFSLNSSNGTITALPQSSATNSATGSQPDTILVDPAFGYFLYTANYIDGTVSGKQITQQTGGLENVQFTPFNGGAEPTALASTTSTAVLQSYDQVVPQ